MKDLQGMMGPGGMPQPPALPKPPQAQQAPVPRVVPSLEQKSEGQMRAFKDSVKKLSGVSFAPIQHSN